MIETGMSFGDIHSFRDLDLILSSVEIPPAKPKENFVDIPGADGSIDMTEALGEVKYSDRTGAKFTFYMNPAGDLSEDAWEAKKKEISNSLNGLRCNITLDKDPDYYWQGRCTVNEHASNKKLRKFVVGARLAPYKLKNDVTRVFVPFCEKNLIDCENADIFFEYGATTQRLDSGFRVTWVENGSSYATIKLFPAKLLVNQTVTLSATIQPSDSNTPKIYGAFFNGASVGHPVSLGAFSKTGKKTYTIGEEANQYDYFGLYIYAVNKADTTGFVSGETYVDYTDLQLELSSYVTEYAAYTPITDPQEITLTNARKTVCPSIIVSDEATVTYSGGESDLGAGTHQILDLQLYEGETPVTVSGTGAIAFVYQEGDL